MSSYTSDFFGRIENLLNIGIALSVEKDHNRLLEMILYEARKITRADAGTLYMVEGDHLVFKIMHNETLNIFKGGVGETNHDMPPVELSGESVAGYVAITKQSVNIPDVHQVVDFNFSTTRRYQELTGYRNVSMLVVPLENHLGQVSGVLQLINARDELGGIIPFAPYFEKVIKSLASQAAIALTNMQFIADIENLLRSFLEVMATAVDARSPYNANHTRRVALMTERMIQVINEISYGPYATVFFDKDRTLQLVMAAWLHDIGKIATPLEIMNKSTRLGSKLELILQRFDYIARNYELEYWKRAVESGNEKESLASTEDTNWIDNQQTMVEKARELLLLVNDPTTFVDPLLAEEVLTIARLKYIDYQGKVLPWLTDEEVKALIVPKGTLTEDERKIMESHVNLTGRMLDKIPFPHELKMVPDWALLHHEYLDGTGYPLGLTGEQIPLEGRILTILDIFDALTAADRPYKKAMSVEEALKIIGQMVKLGKLDDELFKLFYENKVWECLKEEKSL